MEGGDSLFNIGAGELILVLLVAFFIVGPDDLPKVARWLARQLKVLRRWIRELKKETGWDEVERDLRDVKREVNTVKKDLDLSSEVKSVRDEVNRATGDIRKELHETHQVLDTSVQQALHDAAAERSDGAS